MARWMWCCAAAALVATVGPARGQSPAALAGRLGQPTSSRAQAPTPLPLDADSALVMKTAGQPDRRIRVLKVSQYPDGESVADVQDLDTGVRYTLPGKIVEALKKQTKAAPPAVVPVQAQPPAPQPSPPPPAAAVTPPPVQSAPPASLPTLPVVAAPPAPAAAARPVGPTVPLAPTRSADVWKAVTDKPPAAVTPQPAPTVDRRDPWRAVPSSTPAQPTAPQTLPSAVASPPVVRGQAPADETGYARPQYRGPPPGSPPSAPPTVTEERGAVVPASYPQVRRRTFEQQLADETAPHIQTLFTAVRPSVREDAATILAEGRFGSRPEVKRVLAGAVMADPAPTVRAHCIRLLTSLGYHDPEYVAHLRTVADAGHPAVRLAATLALARLAPRG